MAALRFPSIRRAEPRECVVNVTLQIDGAIIGQPARDHGSAALAVAAHRERVDFPRPPSSKPWRRIDARWWTLPERKTIPRTVLDRIDAHVKTMIPILTG
jgi:hypothetical protein